jgi:hypothetical protein
LFWQEKDSFLQTCVFYTVTLVDFDFTDEYIRDRASELRLDPVTNKVYHMVDDPPPNNQFILKRIIKRSSDSDAAMKKRLDVYRNQRDQLLEFYASKKRIFRCTESFTKPRENLMSNILAYLGREPISTGPRMHKYVVAGLPGSRTDEVSEMIRERFGCITGIPINNPSFTQKCYCGCCDHWNQRGQTKV